MVRIEAEEEVRIMEDMEMEEGELAELGDIITTGVVAEVEEHIITVLMAEIHIPLMINMARANSRRNRLRVVQVRKKERQKRLALRQRIEEVQDHIADRIVAIIEVGTEDEEVIMGAFLIAMVTTRNTQMEIRRVPVQDSIKIQFREIN